MSGQPTVWWGNQGSTYAKARDAGAIWAPKLNKAGRTERHWETMLGVEAGDIILHYSNGYLRAIGTAQGPVSDAANPFDSQEWERNGRLIRVHYDDLRTPIPLASIPAPVRIPAAGPFTSVGSVQQGYLYRVDEMLLNVLVRDFAEIRAALPWYEPSETAPVESDIDLAAVYGQFGEAVQT